MLCGIDRPGAAAPFWALGRAAIKSNPAHSGCSASSPIRSQAIRVPVAWTFYCSSKLSNKSPPSVIASGESCVEASTAERHRRQNGAVVTRLAGIFVLGVTTGALFFAPGSTPLSTAANGTAALAFLSAPLHETP
jgi:hypothetical protein